MTTSAPDDEPFWQEMALTPDDDFQKLVYADWLDERADERGAFVRAQIEAERCLPLDPALVEWKRTLDDLLRKHRNEWLAPLKKFKKLHVEFRSGLPGRVALTPENFETLWPQITEALPTVGEVWLRRATGRLRQVLFTDAWEERPPWGVDLGGNALLVGEDLFALQDVEFLTRVRSVSLRGVLLTLPGVPFAVTSIPRVDLSETLLTDEHVERLFARKQTIRWRELNLSRNGLHWEGVDVLCQGAEVSTLRRLDLSHNDLESDAIAALRYSPVGAGLEHLSLAYTGMTDERLIELCTGEPFPKLRSLDICGVVFGIEALDALRESPALPALEFVKLTRPQFNVSPRIDTQLAQYGGRARRGRVDPEHLKAASRLRKHFGDGLWWEET